MKSLMSESIRNTFSIWNGSAILPAKPKRELWTRGLGAVMIQIPNCSCTEPNGCLENDDLENEDLRPRKRRPRKQRPRKRRPRKRRPRKRRPRKQRPRKRRPRKRRPTT